MESTNRNIRVLSIDDEVALTRIMKVNLESQGTYTVKTLNVTPNTVQVTKEFRPDIILMDLLMPEADGFEVANALSRHEETRGIPVIFMSATINPRVKIDKHSGLCISNGKYYLPKPVTTSQVIDSIQEVLEKEDRLP